MATKAPTKKQAVEKPAKRKGPGKPPKNDPDDVTAIQNKIDLYFDSLPVIDEDAGTQERPTYCGLAYALGYASLQSLRENAKAGSAISLPIKIALLRVDITYEKALHGSYPTGAIFALKNRGWTDKPQGDDGEGENRLTIDFTE